MTKEQFMCKMKLDDRPALIRFRFSYDELLEQYELRIAKEMGLL